MPRLSNDIKQDLKRNKPNLALAIFSTLISVAIIAFVIFLAVVNLISVGLCIFAIVIFVMLSAATWFGMFLARKQKTQTLKEIEKETYQFADFVKAKRYYKTYDTINGIKLNVTFNDNTNDIIYILDPKTLKLGNLNSNNTFISFGIGMGGIEVNENGDVVAVKGMLVKSIWLKKKLVLPPSKPGSINVGCENLKLGPSIHIQALSNEDTYYDKKLGYICIGERKHYEIDDVIEIAKGFIVVLRDNEFISVWLKVGNDIKID